MTGQVIVFEGVDCSGKTTTLKFVEGLLNTAGIPYESYRFPSTEGEVGKLIRRTFTGEAKVDPYAMAHLMIADAIDYEEKIRQAKEAGKVVLCDRHTITSGWVYQTEIHPLDTYLAILQPQNFTQPDVVFVFDVPPELAQERLEKKGRDSLYEQADLSKIEGRRNAYLSFPIMMLIKTMVLDGTRPIDVNGEVIYRIIESMRMVKN